MLPLVVCTSRSSTSSVAQSIASLPEADRATVLRVLTPAEAEEVYNDWRFWARPDQLAPPGEWRVWLILAGRGFGKTRCGAEWVLEQVRQGRKRIALVGETKADVRDVMVEGESGILARCDGGIDTDDNPLKMRRCLLAGVVDVRPLPERTWNIVEDLSVELLPPEARAFISSDDPLSK